VLAVSRGHRLAGRESVSVEELADEVVHRPEPPVPDAIMDALIPPRTPSGRTIKRVPAGSSVTEALAVMSCYPGPPGRTMMLS
jgi:hypothetical protein